MTINKGDKVKSIDYTSAIIKLDETYEVIGVEDSHEYDARIIIRHDVYGDLNYPAVWFEKVTELQDWLTGDDTTVIEGGTIKADYLAVGSIQPVKLSLDPIHECKSWLHFFQAIKTGEKTHDLRQMDRPFKVGDYILLREFDQHKGVYTGDSVIVEITYITSVNTPCALSSNALDRNHCILSLKLVKTN